MMDPIIPILKQIKLRFMEEYKERHQEDDNDVFEYDEDGNVRNKNNLFH
jgi:hypothetical protein